MNGIPTVWNALSRIERTRESIDLLLSYFSVKYKVKLNVMKERIKKRNEINKSTMAIVTIINEIVNCNNMTCILVTFSIILVRSCPPYEPND